jgi:hypothetical protein
MAANKILNVPPAYVPNAAGNLLNPGTATGGVGFTSTNPYIVLKHIRLSNKTAGAVSATLYVGATGGSAGGTEFAFAGVSIPANSFVDWYGQKRLDSADFLTGIAGAASSIVIEIDAEIGIA